MSTSAPERESRLPVGSSAKTIAGRPARARATATRCCWPPESSVGPVAEPVAEPDRVDDGGVPLGVGLAAGDRQRQQDVLLGVSVGTRLKDWKTKPIWSRRSRVSSLSSRPFSSVSPTKTWPLVGASSAAQQCISVDFPDPEGPITAVNAPGPKAPP